MLTFGELALPRSKVTKLISAAHLRLCSCPSEFGKGSRSPFATAATVTSRTRMGDTLSVMRGFAEIFYFNLGFSKM